MDFWFQFWSVVDAGGGLMIVLFVLAVTIYWLAIDTLVSLPGRLAMTDPLLREIQSSVDVRFFESDRLLFFKNRKSLLQILVTTAPLLGLLGTVIGMLATFQGLNEGSGNTLDLVAAGISEAMITTETGLVIAIPASFMIMFIDSRINAIETFLLKILNQNQQTENAKPMLGSSQSDTKGVEA